MSVIIFIKIYNIFSKRSCWECVHEYKIFRRNFENILLMNKIFERDLENIIISIFIYNINFENILMSIFSVMSIFRIYLWVYYIWHQSSEYTHEYTCVIFRIYSWMYFKVYSWIYYWYTHEYTQNRKPYL